MAHLEDALVEGQVVRVEKLDNSAQDVDDAVNKSRQLTAPNLLINPNFLINQRGQAEYTGTLRYTVDGWKLNDGSNTVVTVNDGYITVGSLSESQYKGLWQLTENYRVFAGKVMTFSALVRTNGAHCYLMLYDGKRVPKEYIPDDGEWHVVSQTIAADAALTQLRASVNVETGYKESVDVKFAKLELGSAQTLAHQDGAGNWVLNDPPPDPALELAKCQRYYVRYVNPISYDFIAIANGVPAYSDTRYCNFKLYLPQPLAKTAVSIEHNGLRVVNSTTGAAQTIEAVSISYASQNFINVNARCAERPAAGTLLQLEIAKGSWLGISAEP